MVKFEIVLEDGHLLGFEEVEEIMDGLRSLFHNANGVMDYDVRMFELFAQSD